MREFRARFTKADLDTLRRLRAQGLSYKKISERLGRPVSTLRQTMLKPPKITLDDIQERQEKLALAFAAGARITDIAAAVGVTPPAIIKSLENAGFDREMRELVRSGFGQ